MVDVVGLYDALTSAAQQATFRGVPFWMLDSSDETGRRALRFFFPGRDDTEFQDLGALDGQIVITGLIVGDGYVRQSQRLRAALRTAGPGTLLHPWLGSIQVVLMQASAIAYTQTEYRVARFTATFAPYITRTPPTPDVLTQLLNDLDDLRLQAQQLVAQVLAPVGLALSAISYVQSFLGQLGALFVSLTGTSTAASNAAAAPAAALGALAVPTDGTGGAVVSAAMQAPSSAIAQTSARLAPAAIGAASPPAAAPIDARVTSAILINVANAVVAKAAGQPAPGPSLAAAAAALVLADAADAVTDIAFTSQQEARATLASLVAAIDGAATLATLAAAAQPVSAGQTWQALLAARAGVVATLNAEIGVLPAVEQITIPVDMPAWLVAQALTVDDPSQLVSTLDDLVARNRLRGTQVRAGAIEVLA